MSTTKSRYAQKRDAAYLRMRDSFLRAVTAATDEDYEEAAAEFRPALSEAWWAEYDRSLQQQEKAV